MEQAVNIKSSNSFSHEPFEELLLLKCRIASEILSRLDLRWPTFLGSLGSSFKPIVIILNDDGNIIILHNIIFPRKINHKIAHFV